MALEMDAGGVVQRQYRTAYPPPPPPALNSTKFIYFVPPPLMGANLLQGPVKRVGPENRDNLVINSDM
jgi:hypothetical protein